LRNITPQRHAHKFTFAAVCLIGIAIALGGCSSDEPSLDEATPAPVATIDVVPGVTIQMRTAALDSWTSIARRLRSGEVVRDPDYQRLFDLPAYQSIYGNDTTTRLNPIILRTQLEYAFAQEGRKTSHPPKLREFRANYAYIAKYLDEAEALADTLVNRAIVEQALAAAWPFIDEHRRPENLEVLLFAALPSITWYPPDMIILDVGLALAAGPDQLADILAAVLIRSLAPPAMVEPHEASNGREALQATFHKLHQASIIGWLEDYPNLQLDQGHETYQRPDPTRQRVLITSAATLEHFLIMLETLVDPDSDTIDKVGGSLDDLLRIGRSYEPIGYAMSTLIIEHQGRDAWIEAVVGGPVTWLQAYQNAAISGVAQGELASMPAFDDLTFARLLALLELAKTR